jgi:hypothetical protein
MYTSTILWLPKTGNLKFFHTFYHGTRDLNSFPARIIWRFIHLFVPRMSEFSDETEIKSILIMQMHDLSWTENMKLTAN